MAPNNPTLAKIMNKLNRINARLKKAEKRINKNEKTTTFLLKSADYPPNYTQNGSNENISMYVDSDDGIVNIKIIANPIIELCDSTPTDTSFNIYSYPSGMLYTVRQMINPYNVKNNNSFYKIDGLPNGNYYIEVFITYSYDLSAWPTCNRKLCTLNSKDFSPGYITIQ
jgi:hypothetical protein